ncbi:MAG: hypothetical protein HYZ73_00545 [Elusimicrobia bacterium]|nr:hypothetical protein [Elusimicrobiota bacterium]
MKTREQVFEQAIHRLMVGEYPAARVAIQQTVRGLRGPEAQSLTAWGAFYLGMLYRERGQGFRAFKLFTEALHRHHTLSDPSGQGWALHALGTIACQGDHWAQALPLFRKAVGLGHRSSDISLVAAALNDLSRVALLEGRLQKAKQLLGNMTFPLASPVEFIAKRTTILVTLTWGRLALEESDGEMAAAYAAQSEELSRRWGDEAVQTEIGLLLAEIALQRRMGDLAVEHTRTALARARQFGQRWVEAEALLLAGRIALARDDTQGAQETLEEVLGLAKRLGSRLLRLRALATVAMVCERSQQAAEALTHARRVLRLLAPRELPQLQDAMHALGRRVSVAPEEQALWKVSAPRSLSRTDP